MRRTSAISAAAYVALLLAMLPQGAQAFEQQVVQTGDAAAPFAPGLELDPKVLKGVPGVELTVPSATVGSQQTGATITFPGLGTLGALPKLDFGLELLYGSPETNSPGETPGDVQPDAFTVHGSVKKTF